MSGLYGAMTRHGKMVRSGQLDAGKKWVILSGLKKGFGSIGLRVESGQVGLTHIFHMNLLYIYIYRISSGFD